MQKEKQNTNTIIYTLYSAREREKESEGEKRSENRHTKTPTNYPPADQKITNNCRRIVKDGGEKGRNIIKFLNFSPARAHPSKLTAAMGNGITETTHLESK